MNSIVARDDTAPPAASMGIGALRVRALSALVLAVPALAAVYVGAPVFDLLFGLVALLMAFEWDRLCAAGAKGGKANDPASWALFAAIAAITLAAVLQAHELALWLAVGGFSIVFLIARGIERPAPLLQALGALYRNVFSREQ